MSIYNRQKKNKRKFADGGYVLGPRDTRRDYEGPVPYKQSYEGLHNEETKAVEISRAAAAAENKRVQDAFEANDLNQMAADKIMAQAQYIKNSRALQDLKKAEDAELLKIKKIKAFQAAYGLKADGIWGPKTAGVFKRVQDMQKNLNIGAERDGREVLQVDGMLGEKTLNAQKLREQEINGMGKASVVEPKDMALLNPTPEISIPAKKPTTKKEVRKATQTTKKEARKSRRNDRKEARQARRAKRKGTEVKRLGGIFYSSIEK